MATYYGIEPNTERVCDDLGATHQTIRMAVDAEGVVSLAGRKIKSEPDTLVFWIEGEAGGIHGIVNAEDAKTLPPRECRQIVADDDRRWRKGYAPDATNRGVVVSECSGRGSVLAGVLKITEPVCIVISGYKGRRDWEYIIVTTSGDGLTVETVAVPVYRERYAVIEKL